MAMARYNKIINGRHEAPGPRRRAKMMLEDQITQIFRTEYAVLSESATDDTERANALETARERAAALIPEGRFGSFDDETLSFREDATSNT
jgi:hypothetical protein